MRYISNWENLSDARDRVVAATGCSQEEVEADICGAMIDGAIKIRCKPRKHLHSPMRPPKTPLEGIFQVPDDLKPDDLDWANSRPTQPWLVPRGAYRPCGHWHLDWIKLLKADVTNALCSAPGKAKPASENAPAKPAARSRSRPAFERAQRAFRALYPDGAPTQADVPNKILCEKIAQWLKKKDLPSVSDDSILRAVGRRN